MHQNWLDDASLDDGLDWMMHINHIVFFFYFNYLFSGVQRKNNQKCWLSKYVQTALYMSKCILDFHMGCQNTHAHRRINAYTSLSLCVSIHCIQRWFCFCSFGRCQDHNASLIALVTQKSRAAAAGLKQSLSVFLSAPSPHIYTHTHTQTHTRAHTCTHTHTHTHTHMHTLLNSHTHRDILIHSSYRWLCVIHGAQLWSMHHLPLSYLQSVIPQNLHQQRQ